MSSLTANVSGSRWLRWPKFRFSLRTLFIVITIFVPILGWVARVKIAAVQQRNAIAMLQTRGHYVQPDPPVTGFLANILQRHLDKDAFQTVHRVQVVGLRRIVGNGSPIPLDLDDLNAISRMNSLSDVEIFQDNRWPQRSTLNNSQRLSDSDLRFLTYMTTLECIQTDVELNEQSLLRLTKLPKIYALTLPNSAFSDKVLAQLGNNPQIKYLEFDASQVSANGLKHLESLPALHTLSLWRLKDDDALLPIVARCKALVELVIFDSDLTMEDAMVINRMRIMRLRTHDCRIEAEVVKALNDSTSRPDTFLCKSQ